MSKEKKISVAAKAAKKQPAEHLKKYRFKKGRSGNPTGMKRGSISITALVKAELEKCPKGEDKKTYVNLFVQKILDKAIKDGNDGMIGKIWAYVDGLPKESIDITVIDKEAARKELESNFES